jgi:hypothetical protein
MSDESEILEFPKIEFDHPDVQEFNRLYQNILNLNENMRLLKKHFEWEVIENE